MMEVNEDGGGQQDEEIDPTEEFKLVEFKLVDFKYVVGHLIASFAIAL